MQKKLSNIIRKAAFFMIPIASAICYAGISDDVYASSETTEDSLIYNFRDAKKEGTITFVKRWKDGKKEEDRNIPNIEISTKKPRKNVSGYTVIFHGNGLKFADGSEENMVVYNSAGEIVQGEYKMAVGNNVIWCKKPDGVEAVEISNDGILSVPITEDIDLWAKDVTFEIKGYDSSLYQGNGFEKSIPSTVTEVIFTDEIKPSSAEIIDVDTDGDGGVIAWTENDGTVMKVSTQIKGIKAQAAVNSSSMFYKKSNIKKIDLKMLDTSNVTDMSDMFAYCRGLINLDLSPLDTANVTDMMEMFSECRSLTNLDMTGWDTSKVTDMYEMFSYCNGLTSLDVTGLDTSNVTDMDSMFYGCSGLKSLDLSCLNVSKVTTICDKSSYGSGFLSHCSKLQNIILPNFTNKIDFMGYMFYSCTALTNINLTPLDTSNVTSMCQMFDGCSGLISLDLTPLDTSNVTDMSYMFSWCSGLTSLDLTSLNTSNVTDMKLMFYDCSGLTSLDLTGLDTSKVTDMESMFDGCDGLTSITTGPKFKFVGASYRLDGTWQNTAGETFNGNGGTANFPSNVADTYTKIS